MNESYGRMTWGRQRRCNTALNKLYNEPGEFSVHNIQMALVKLLKDEAKKYPKDTSTHKLWNARAIRLKRVCNGLKVDSARAYFDKLGIEYTGNR